MTDGAQSRAINSTFAAHIKAEDCARNGIDAFARLYAEKPVPPRIAGLKTCLDQTPWHERVRFGTRGGIATARCRLLKSKAFVPQYFALILAAEADR